MQDTSSHEPTPRHPVAENIRAIVDLERAALRKSSTGERAGGRISNAIGTMTFVTVHTAGMLLWIGWNVFAPQGARFDAYPFGLLTFIVSLEGVLIATFVLIAQNRISRQSDQRDHLNLQVNLLAEQEMTLVLNMLRQISDRLGIVADARDDRAEQLAQKTNVYDLVRSIQEQLPESERE
jgi:uncharacterized membrane protein